MDLPDQGLVEHQEGKAGIGKESASPTVVHSVQTSTDLVKVVDSAGSPLPEVVSEEVVAVLEFVGISLGAAGIGARGINVRPEVHILVVQALRGAESQVVVTGGCRLAETSALRCNKPCGVLQQRMISNE